MKKAGFFLIAVYFLLLSSNLYLQAQGYIGGPSSYNYKNYINNSKKIEKISEFSTKFNPDSKSRTHNLKLASMAIDQKIIKPGEVFSFNETVGETTPEKGYREAVIFVEGKEEKGYGGGICQASSTLYNAALDAGLEIVERHPHSKPVHYVEKDKDAATSYGSVDLKIKNNFDYSIKINTYTYDGNFTVEILKV